MAIFDAVVTVSIGHGVAPALHVGSIDRPEWGRIESSHPGPCRHGIASIALWLISSLFAMQTRSAVRRLCSACCRALRPLKVSGSPLARPAMSPRLGLWRVGLA